MSTNKQIALSGAKWMTVSTLTTSLVGVLRLAILTRFLEKTDFGIVAIITFVLGLTQTFVDLGFSSAIMHKKDLSQREFSSLFWIQLSVFVLLYAIVVLLSPLVANFYHEPSIRVLLPIALLDLICMGVGRLYNTILQKEFQFKVIALRNIISALASLVLAVLLAMNGFGVYSLILSTLFHSLFDNVWNFVAGQKSCKLKLIVSVKESFPLIKIGLFQTGTQVVDYFASKLDVLIIGKLLGTELLGVYTLAKELVQKLYAGINSIVNKVALPFFAKLQDDNNAMCKQYSRLTRWLSLIDFPIFAVMSLLSAPIISILYGSGYSDVAEMLTILAIWALFVSFNNPVGSLAIAKGRTDVSFMYTIVRVFLTLPIVYITSLVSIQCVAWGQVFLVLFGSLLSWYMLIYKLIGMRLKDYLASFGGIFILVATLGAIMFLVVNENWIGITNNILSIVVYGLLFATLYLIGVLVFFKNTLIDIVRFTLKK